MVISVSYAFVGGVITVTNAKSSAENEKFTLKIRRESGKLFTIGCHFPPQPILGHWVSPTGFGKVFRLSRLIFLWQVNCCTTDVVFCRPIMYLRIKCLCVVAPYCLFVVTWCMSRRYITVSVLQFNFLVIIKLASLFHQHDILLIAHSLVHDPVAF